MSKMDKPLILLNIDMNDFDENDLDAVANDIISQIKNQGKSIKKFEAEEHPELTKEEVDDFILEQASNVIRDSAEVISTLKDTLISGATANDAIAFAEVLKSFTSAVEILNKRQISDEKNKTQKEIKTMDIESKKEISSDDNQNKLLLSQNEIIKEMLKLSNSKKKELPNTDDGKIIDI